MEQDKNDDNGPYDEMLRGLVKRMQHATAPGPFAVLVVDAVCQLAHVLLDERDARRAMVRLAEHRDQRLDGEIRERAQRQLEITGRLTAIERLLARPQITEYAPCNGKHPPPPCGDPCCWHFKPSDLAAKMRGEFETSADTTAKRTEASLIAGRNWSDGIERRHPTNTIDDLRKSAYRQRDELLKLKQSADTTVDWKATAELRSAALRENVAQRDDLKERLAATRKLIDDVWVLVAESDGFGSPYYSEPGIDDITPMQAIASVLASLRAQIAARDSTISNAEIAMGEIYAAVEWPEGVERRHSGLVKDIERLVEARDSHNAKWTAQQQRVGDMQIERSKLKQAIADQAVMIMTLRSAASPAPDPAELQARIKHQETQIANQREQLQELRDNVERYRLDALVAAAPEPNCPPSLTREQAIEVARTWAFEHRMRGVDLSYLPDEDNAATWMPHEWVIDALTSGGAADDPASASARTRSSVLPQAMANPEKFTYRITWSEEDQEYVGLCDLFPSLSWLSKTRPEALEGIARLVADAVMDMLNTADRQSDDDQICGV